MVARVFRQMSIEEYFNTTELEDSELSEAKSAASWQDELVLSYFRRIGRGAGPSECYKALMDSGVIPSSTPLTSIRRSITTLTKRGFLDKTSEKRTGQYGKPEYLWRKA